MSESKSCITTAESYVEAMEESRRLQGAFDANHPVSPVSVNTECRIPHGENCCCQCSKRLADHSHPMTDGKRAGALRGYACAIFVREGVIHSGWPEHCHTCEEFVLLDPETRPCPHGITRPSKCPECSREAEREATSENPG